MAADEDMASTVVSPEAVAVINNNDNNHDNNGNGVEDEGKVDDNGDGGGQRRNRVCQAAMTVVKNNDGEAVSDRDVGKVNGKVNENGNGNNDDIDLGPRRNRDNSFVLQAAVTVVKNNDGEADSDFGKVNSKVNDDDDDGRRRNRENGSVLKRYRPLVKDHSSEVNDVGTDENGLRRSDDSPRKDATSAVKQIIDNDELDDHDDGNGDGQGRSHANGNARQDAKPVVSNSGSNSDEIKAKVNGTRQTRNRHHGKSSSRQEANLVVNNDSDKVNDSYDGNSNANVIVNGNGNGSVRVEALPEVVNIINNNNNNNNDNSRDVKATNGSVDVDVRSEKKAEAEEGLAGRGSFDDLQDVECAWSWVVLAGLIVACVIGAGQVQCVNIYFVIFLEEFKRSTSFTAWISAAQSTALCVTGPLSSLLLLKMGARLTMYTGAILMAICLTAVFFATSVPYLIVVYACIGASQSFLTAGNLAAISLYFRRRASFATGIVLAGAGIGTMVTGLELEWSVETFGWRGAMLIQAGIVLNICVCGSLVFQRKRWSKGPESERNGHGEDHALGHQQGAPTSSDRRPPSPDRTSIRSLSLDPLFWLSVASFLCLQASFSVMLTIFKGFVVAAGLRSSFPTVLTTVGVGSMVGRVLSGPISGLFCAPIYLTVAALTCTVANALYVLATVPWALAVVGAAFGFFQGQMFVSWLLSMSWIYGQDKMPVVRGHVMFFGVIASLLFPPLAGLTVDITGDYKIALMMSSGANLCCGICGLVTYFIHRRKHRPSPDINGQAVQDQLDRCTKL